MNFRKLKFIVIAHKTKKMVNNLNANNEIEKSTVSRSCSSSDDNGTINLLIGCESNDDINAENQIKSYVRRRKCNENVQICEKKKKRESRQKVKSEKKKF